MVSEAVTKVRLDTSVAGRALEALTKKAGASARKVGANIRGAVARGLGGLSLGAGVGAGLAAIKGSTSSGFGDILSVATSGIGESINEFAFGSADETARAKKRALTDIQQSSAYFLSPV